MTVLGTRYAQRSTSGDDEASSAFSSHNASVVVNTILASVQAKSEPINDCHWSAPPARCPRHYKS